MKTIRSEEVQSRYTALCTYLNTAGADGFIVFSNEYDNRANIQYLSGFTGSTAVIMVGMTGAYLIVDSRYSEQAEEESYIPVLHISDRDPWDAIRRAASELSISRIAFEEEKLSVKRHILLQKAGLVTFPVPQIVMQLRAVKGLGEIALMRRASKIAASAFEAIIPYLHIGMTERQMAALLANAIRERGADQLVKGHFVAASGLRGCRPHGVFSDRVVEYGDMVTFDFGAVVGGYVSDMTRTIAFGSPCERMLDIYDAVLEANRMALKSTSSKATGEALDAVASNYLSKRGYHAYIKHSLGHGIGLELHELPNINKANRDTLPVGTIVTIEPGIYIPGLGGVRIEDAVVVTKDGHELLTSDSPKELRFLI